MNISFTCKSFFLETKVLIEGKVNPADIYFEYSAATINVAKTGNEKTFIWHKATGEHTA